MKYITNSLWFLVSLPAFIAGMCLLFPALATSFLLRFLCVFIVCIVFSSLSGIVKALGGSPQDIRAITTHGKTIINKI